jgi:mannosyltransferase OCH1-like enzyme
VWKHSLPSRATKNNCHQWIAWSINFYKKKYGHIISWNCIGEHERMIAMFVSYVIRNIISLISMPAHLSIGYKLNDPF